MSSTKSGAAGAPSGGSAPALAVFEQHVLAARAKVADPLTRYFPRAADPVAKTYYRTRERKSMSPADFVISDLQPDPATGVQDPARAAAALEAYWRTKGRPELAELARPLAELGWKSRPAVVDSEDVSPFIYVMF